MSSPPTDPVRRRSRPRADRLDTIVAVPTDRQTLNLVAAVLCGVGSLAALIDGWSSGGLGNRTSRAGILSGLFGTVGSIAWAVSAFQDRQESRGETDLA